MKKSVKSALSLILALLLMMSVPMTARAEVVEDADVPTAKVTWTEELMPCTATLWIPGEEYTIPVPITDASIVHVTDGEERVITWPRGSYVEQTPVFTANPSMADYFRLETLLGELGYGLGSMCQELSEEERNLVFFNTPKGLLDGKYSYGSEVDVIDAEWLIQRGALTGRVISPSDGEDEGKIVGIPLSCTKIKLIVISLD